MTAVQLASINTARYFGFRDLGAVAPGYRADFLLLDDLETFAVHSVYKNGRKVAEGGRYLVDGPGAASTEIRGTMTVDWPHFVRRPFCSFSVTGSNQRPPTQSSPFVCGL